jgi:signal transduction histidine kinase
MLQHSRLGNTTKEPADINALCDESLKLAWHAFKAKEKTFNASFETRFDPGLPHVKVIAQDIDRVMINLINNAFYAVHEKKKRGQSELIPETRQTESPYKPRVIVSTKKEGNKIFITVSDNGMGIPSPILNKIFQPFFTTKPTGEGTGLGLSMSYDIITKSHGGELLVKSKEGLGN